MSSGPESRSKAALNRERRAGACPPPCYPHRSRRALPVSMHHPMPVRRHAIRENVGRGPVPRRAIRTVLFIATQEPEPEQIVYQREQTRYSGGEIGEERGVQHFTGVPILFR